MNAGMADPLFDSTNDASRCDTLCALTEGAEIRISTNKIKTPAKIVRSPLK
jgi:hypothetical protein